MPADTAPPRRTQAERVAESDTRMLQAALRLVATRGYSQATLEAIGAESGYSRGLVSHQRRSVPASTCVLTPGNKAWASRR